MEKDIPCKWKSKESWNSNSHLRQPRNRTDNKRNRDNNTNKRKFKINIVNSLGRGKRMLHLYKAINFVMEEKIEALEIKKNIVKTKISVD